MKTSRKRMLLLSLLFCLSLTACGAAPAEPSPAESGPVPGAEEPLPEPLGRRTGTFRVMGYGGEDGALLLAEADGGPDPVFTAPSLAGIVPTRDGETAEGAVLAPGMLVEVTWGLTLETWPAQFGEVAAVDLLSDGFDDLGRLYLDVLEDLWAADPGLNGGIAKLGLDLSGTRLRESEQAAAALLFGWKHGLDPVRATWTELRERGEFTGDPAGDGDAKFWHWEDGCFFSITEKEPEPAAFGAEAVAFDAGKWRSSLGAFFFLDCAASRSPGASWGGYSVGAHAVS